MKQKAELPPVLKPAPVLKICANCKYGIDFKATSHRPPRLKIDSGRCTWDEKPPLPLSVTLAFGWHGLHKTWVNPTWPSCPTWEKKEGDHWNDRGRLVKG